MTAAVTVLNPGAGGDSMLTDTLTTVDGAAAPASSRAQVMKLAYGSQGDARLISDTYGLPTTHVPPTFMRVGFAEVGAGLQGLAAQELALLQTGAGMSVNQSGGNLVITTGTTANAETVIRSNLKFRGSLLARYKAVLSQRIANQTFRFELADLIGEDLAYTINSATSVTVTFPATNPFTAANVGQFLRLSEVTGAAGIPGRFAIASVSGLTVTFTVAAWPATGSGTLTLYGHNWLANEYSGTTATNSNFDCQRRGWNSGNTVATISTTASPGHVGQINFDVMAAGFSDSLVASNASYQWSNRASRIENIPDEDVDLYFFLVVQNGSTAPASTTTLTVGFIQVEDQGRQKVRIASSDPTGTHAQPVQCMGGSVGISNVPNVNVNAAIPAGTNAIGDVGVQLRANATGAASTNHLVSAATTNAAIVKASAGRVVGWSFVNTTASFQYVKLHNSATAPTAGAGVTHTIAIPPNGVNTANHGPHGIAFSAGIGRTVVTGSADTDATATTVGAVVGDLFFA